MIRLSNLTDSINLTPINPSTMKREPIGFNRERESHSVTVQDNNTPSCNSACAHRANVDNIIINVVRGYLEDRSKKCYRQGLDQDLMNKLDKIFVKFYETIE